MAAPLMPDALRLFRPQNFREAISQTGSTQNFREQKERAA